ncbi:MAG: hypothetical protein R3F02_02125 [Thiolinea sp.]
MSAEDDFFNWSGRAEPDRPELSDYRRKLHIRYPPELQAQAARSDPFNAVAGLRLLPEDRAYLHGFMAALQLPEHIRYGLLLEYRQRWERAAQRAPHPNQADNSGRRSANIWIQQGAEGFIDWD